MAFVDDADYGWLKHYKWHASPMRSNYSQVFYALRNMSIGRNKQRLQLMHRLILGLPPGDKRHTDHIDGNGLNNCRSNLRVCTNQQNQQSSRKRKGVSKYKGVNWHHRDRKWYSYICVKGKLKNLGSFGSEIEAARAYDQAALKYFGEFALTNKTLNLEGEIHA